MKFDFCSTDFSKIPQIKFHENSPSGCGVVTCRRTDRRTDMTKPIAALRNFANAPKISIGGNMIHKVAQCIYNDILLF
jgi:hypothetical protein